MENKKTLKFYPSAERDLEEIFQYISVKLCNPDAALNLINEFGKAFDNICYFPESCPLVNNDIIKDKTMRKLIVNNYIAFYRVKNEEVQVLRVLYSMRKYEVIL